MRSRVVCGRKFCSRCKRWRHACDFHCRTWEGEHARTLQSVCKTCMRLITRERRGHKPRSDTHCRNGHPWTPQNTGRRLDDGCRWCRACKRERYAQLRRDREWYERKKEYDRIYLEGRRRRNGVREREFKHRAPRAPDFEGSRDLPIEPFVLWLERKVLRHGGVDAFAALVAMDGAPLRRVLKRLDRGRPKRSVRLDLVDRVLTREGSTLLQELYPELYDAEVADAA